MTYVGVVMPVVGVVSNNMKSEGEGGHSSKYIIVECLHMPLQLVTRTLFNEFRIGMQLGKPIMV